MLTITTVVCMIALLATSCVDCQQQRGRGRAVRVRGRRIRPQQATAPGKASANCFNLQMFIHKMFIHKIKIHPKILKV